MLPVQKFIEAFAFSIIRLHYFEVSVREKFFVLQSVEIVRIGRAKKNVIVLKQVIRNLFALLNNPYVNELCKNHLGFKGIFYL